MPAHDPPRVNVADRLAAAAAERPDATAVVAMGLPIQRGTECLILPNQNYPGEVAACITFGRLNEDADTLARGLIAMGIGPGKRIALLVKPGIEFVTLVFALLRAGATMVLVDAGLGKKNLVRCLASTEPDGFVAIPIGQAMRIVKRKHFPKAKLNVTVGRRWLWGGETLDSVRRLGSLPSPSGGGTEGGGEAGTRDTPTLAFPLRGRESSGLPRTSATDPAAIVFTSGSTGPPKGVLYTHQTFVTQCDEIQRQYDLRPGGIDLACFPLFGLFNVACGITTVLPEMDFSRPASCDPKKVLAAANQWKVTQAFGSPAVWDRLSQHCEQTGDSIPTLRKVFSCGAPVPAKVLKRTLACVHHDAEMHTPYGATESLPVATIEAQEILNETAAKTDEGAGVCVGKKFDTIDWRIIRISDDPLLSIDQTEELPQGEIGELIVRGPQVSEQYLKTEPRPSGSDQPAPTHNELSKIQDGNTVWHRIGDVGYFDEHGRFWYCGRKSQRVRHRNGDLFADQIEAVINTLPSVERSALVSIDSRPVLITEPAAGVAKGLTWDQCVEQNPGLTELWYGNGSHNEADKSFTEFPRTLSHSKLPTDIRHNSKIRREELAVWAEKQLRERG